MKRHPLPSYKHRDTPSPDEQDNDKDSLSSIVSKLVKAAMRGKDPNDYGDDLDKYVADILVRSNTDKKQLQLQQQQQRQQEELNNKAYLPSGTVVDRANSNGLKTNKRFLSSIIKSTDDHNQALIRAEEKRANEMTKELLAELDKKAVERERIHSKERRAHEIANEFLAELDRKAITRVKKTGSLNNNTKNDKDKFQYGRMRMDEIQDTSRRRPQYSHHRQQSPSGSASPYSLESSQYQKPLPDPDLQQQQEQQQQHPPGKIMRQQHQPQQQGIVVAILIHATMAPLQDQFWAPRWTSTFRKGTILS
ncbi:hypothetical protein BGZ97_004526 [Linnemannia gamsii]|uniref:Uncharacterized protein n=1 Tax=Linnemannia gamsii TaxID=64522 RepID=A0A9P6USR4_9FUNG|nr:hypothetical protein BGZ97_004526 [Linnemannia gamsii]